jgi:hypothetical protein
MSISKVFIYSAGALLAVTGLAKIYGSTFGGTPVMNLADPIFSLPFRYLLLVVGLAELVASALCFTRPDSTASPMLVAWLASGFLLYRFGLWLVDWKKPCGCLGSITDALHLSERGAEDGAKIVLLYLLVGSCWSLSVRILNRSA